MHQPHALARRKPGLYMIVPIVSVVSNNVQTIETIHGNVTWTIVKDPDH